MRELGREDPVHDSGRSETEAGRSLPKLGRETCEKACENSRWWSSMRSRPDVREEVVDGGRPLRADRTAMPLGIAGIPPMAEVRGEARGGVLTGPGSLDRALCTRCSSRCICPIRPRIWYSDFEAGIAGDGSAAWPLSEGTRACFLGFWWLRGLGVVEGSLPACRDDARAEYVVDTSDMGGDGGEECSEGVEREAVGVVIGVLGVSVTTDALSDSEEEKVDGGGT